MTASPAFTRESRPAFKRGVRLQHDKVRDLWVIQGPERAWLPDETATQILRELDGATPVADIAAKLAARYEAPVETIARDVLALLTQLGEKGLVHDIRSGEQTDKAP